MSLADIKTKGQLKPPKICLYGPGGIGKTTFASTMPDVIIVQTEDGIGKLKANHFDVCKAYDDGTDKSFIGRLNTLLNEEHDFKVLAIDSLDWLEALIHKHVCEENGWKEIGSQAFGKGYAAALEVWKDYVRLIDRIRDERKMTILQIAHDKVVKYDDPTTESYDRHQIKLNNRAADLIIEHCDAVFFTRFKRGAVQKKNSSGGLSSEIHQGDRTIFTQDNPNWMAKNRYGLPAEMPFDWKQIREEMIK
tara:strand:+ start:1419 stop:2165 length:747 start_codon:yes stop_codon:yes gene_type:complete